MAGITQQSRTTSHMVVPGNPVHSPDNDLTHASSSTTVQTHESHHESASSPPPEIVFDDDEIFSQAYTSAATGFFTAPPPLPANRMDQSNPMPSPFSFFASTTLPSEDHREKSQSNTKTLRIELAKSELVLMTGKTTTLQGVLYVNLQKSTKVKSLQMEFSGRSSVTWVDGKNDKAQDPEACVCIFAVTITFSDIDRPLH